MKDKAHALGQQKYTNNPFDKAKVHFTKNAITRSSLIFDLFNLWQLLPICVEGFHNGGSKVDIGHFFED